MAYSVDIPRLESVFTKLRKDPKDQQGLVDLWDLLKPIINLTVERFPAHMHDDMGQEIRMFLMKRAAYLSKAYFDGKIKNPTNYLFRVCFNAGINYYKKEAKTEDHLMPLDDLKMEPIYRHTNARKDKIITEIREETQAFIKMHFRKPNQRQTAERFMVAMLRGERPSFTTLKVSKFAKTTQRPAKDTFSIVQIKIRELMAKRINELLDQDE